MTDEPLRLKWGHTWPDRERDFVAKDTDGKSIGRVYFSEAVSHRAEQWYWTCYGRYRNRRGSDSGFAASKNEAARMVERAWFGLVERVDSED